MQASFQEYFIWFFCFVIIVCMFSFIKAVLRARKNALEFPQSSKVKMKFKECAASGRSHASTFTALAGASNCLQVVVTDTELWIRLPFPFNLVGEYSDCIHRIPIESISDVTRSGKKIFLEFRRHDNTPARFELVLRKSDEFLSALAKSMPPPIPKTPP